MLNTGIRLNKFILIIMYCLSCVYSLKEYDAEEVVQCRNTKVALNTDCFYNMTSLTCCYYKMSLPYHGEICVPMPVSAKTYKTANETDDTILPGNLTFSGYLDCNSVYVNTRILIYIIFSLFILI